MGSVGLSPLSFLTLVICILFFFPQPDQRCVGPSGWLRGKEAFCQAADRGSILGGEGPLGKGMATHSSILAWGIPWTEEPGELQTIGSQKRQTQLSH